MQKYKVDEIEQGKRLDIYALALLPELSRASVQKLIERGQITVNKQVMKTGYKLKYGDIVNIDYSLKDQSSIPDIDLHILFEDDDCLVINKPSGVLSHSKGAFNPEATVATFVAQHSKAVEGDRSGIVHRLDRATSGVMICAKTPEALSWLQKQFSQRKVKKTYIAKIQGHIEPEEAVIDMPIERNPKKPQTFRVGSNGKSATTRYLVIKSGETHQLLELQPETGRTHQLRVHLVQLGHPIVGDTLYGGEQADRLYLHALNLELTLPSRTRKIFTADLPSDFVV